MPRRSNDTINTNVNGKFNADAQLFNDNDPVAPPNRFLRPTLDPRPEYERSPAPTLRTRFGEEERVAEQRKPSPYRKPLYGSFAGVRSARNVHQHEFDLWSPQAFPAVVGDDSRPDPSDADLAQQYEDYQLFSYLPPTMEVGEEEFRAMSRPSNRPAYLTENLENMGIRRSMVGRGEPFAIGDGDPDTRQLLIRSPFSRGLNRGCAGRLETLLGVNR